MVRKLAGIFGAAALALTGTAQAQSNALLGGGAGPQGATRDLSGAIANGYQPFSLGAFERYLAEASFTVTERQAAPDASGVGIVAKAPNGMPFLFLFTDCGRQGCLFMEAVQPFAPKKIGMPISLAEMNDYNRNSPLQLFMTAEANDEVGLRWVLPALVGCDDACAQSGLTLYFGAVMSVYEQATKASRQMLVEVPFEAEGEATGFAALTPDAPWWAASAAFGAGPDVARFWPEERLAERLATEIGRAVDALRPRAVGFPALIDE